MKLSNSMAIKVVALIGVVGAAYAQPIVFPAKGQSNQQMEQDKFNCYSWAKQQSGFDPVSPPPATAAAPAQQKSVAGGVGRGLIGGAAVGAIVGDSSKAAKRGAALGGVVGGLKRSHENTQAANRNANAAASRSTAGSSTYNRAFSACMEGKGYTVK